jgi:membrane fusion protein (multidrug efflux system)
MLKLLLQQFKILKMRLPKNTVYIFTVCLITGSLLTLSFYSTATTHPHLSASVKRALTAATTSNPMSATLRDTLVKPLANNSMIATNTLYNTLPENQPTSSPADSSFTKVSSMPSTSEFPSELPNTIDNNLSNNEQDSPDNINTPEYVIIRSSDQATFSSETSARVALLPIKEGSYFKSGDILLEMDCREQQAELKKAKAQQQAMNEAQKSAEKLQSYGSISEFELIKAQSDAAMSNAEVDKLKAIVDKCTLKAPFNGAVAELMVHAHETVKPGDPLMRIVNTDNLELQMQVPSAWLQWIRIGTKFNVHVSEINKSIAATVTKINPQIDSVSQTVKIIGIITENDPELRPGMSGQAIFPNNPDLNKSKSIN